MSENEKVIPDITYLRYLSNTAIFCNEVDEFLVVVVDEMVSSANLGVRSVGIPYTPCVRKDDKLINDLAFSRLRDEGYTVEEYGDSTLVKW